MLPSKLGVLYILSSLVVISFLVFMKIATFLIMRIVEYDYFNAGHILGKSCKGTQT